MAIQEGRWDCRSCGTVGILGRRKSCPNCGRSRPEGTRFYLPEDAQEVTDEARLQEARSGADWLCSYCGASNSATLEACGGCGADRADSERQAVRDYALDEIPRSGDNAPDSPARQEGARTPPPRRRGSLRKFLVAGGVVGGILLLLFLVFRPRHETLTVTGFSWEREIDVEAYRTVTEEGWDLPHGARVKKKWRDIHHYEDVLDHYETRTRKVSERVQTGTERYVCGKRDLGNGYFEDRYCTRPKYETRYRTETYREPVYRKEPVYRMKYRYDVEKWVHDRTKRAAGEDREPEWPPLRLAKNERAGKRTEHYFVHFTDEEKKRYRKEVSEAQWRRYEVGKRYSARVSRSGEVLEVTFPETKR
ncbi:MAG: hypothetical protein D6812_04740 [Deltaproteobacteria bacterium]|nr:MAG: hypothetical protein D6812_04740 [Deltaproteobacteria bacterium]